MFTPPEIPAGAYDALAPGLREASDVQEPWTPDAGLLPTLFISHGAPPLLDDAKWMQELARWAQGLPKPRAILIVSAHWEAAPLMLSSPQAGTELVYDFGGFAPRYYTLRYPTPDAHDLAALVAACIPDGMGLHEHPNRGLDHGAWVPLMVMYPRGDVPVLQLSLPTSDPAALLRLGEHLRPLREAGVLIIGSGFMTHGLPFLTPQALAGQIPGWSRDFDAWALEALQA
ncbi:MAG: dioxygenase, partial [Actinomycetales bacterium]